MPFCNSGPSLYSQQNILYYNASADASIFFTFHSPLYSRLRSAKENRCRPSADGVEAARWEGRPGVWIGNRKLCSLGMCVRHWVSFHGFALNVGNDLSLFSAITLCGLHDAEATSLSRECGDDSLSMQEVKDVCTREFQTLFADPPVAPC